MIKKIFVIITLVFLSVVPCVSAEVTPATINSSFNVQTQQPNPVEYKFCMRNYQIPALELYFRTLSSISACNYKIIEMQSKSERVLFSIWGKEYWAIITKQNSGASTLRILPADNNYYFNKEMIDKIFTDIDNHKAIKINQVAK